MANTYDETFLASVLAANGVDYGVFVKRYPVENLSYKAFVRYMTTVVMPALVKKFRTPEESYEETLERLKQKHINFLSQQTPPTLSGNIDGSYSDEISPAGPWQNCYDRKGGLPNFIYQNLEGTGIDFYRHTSPVARAICKPDQRAVETRANLRRVVIAAAKKTGIPSDNSEKNPLAITVSEVRLLSVLHRWLDITDKYTQRQQIEEMYFALLYVSNRTFKATIDGKTVYIKPQFEMCDFGVNAVRSEKLSDPLLGQINRRYFNETLEQLFQKFGIKHESLEQARATLSREIRKIDLSDPNAITNFRVLLKTHDTLEAAALEKNVKLWQKANIITTDEKQKKILAAFRLIHDLYFSRKYDKNKKYNYALPAMMIILKRAMGIEVAMGCEDNKDRAGFTAITVETLEIFYDKNKRFPNFDNKADLDNFYQIQANVFNHSCTQAFNEHSCAPGVRGFQLSADNGNPYINAHSPSAKLFKDCYRPSFKQRIISALQPKSKKQGILTSAVFGVLFFLFSSVMGPTTAMADEGVNVSTPTHAAQKRDETRLTREEKKTKKESKKEEPGSAPPKKDDSVATNRPSRDDADKKLSMRKGTKFSMFKPEPADPSANSRVAAEKLTLVPATSSEETSIRPRASAAA